MQHTTAELAQIAPWRRSLDRRLIGGIERVVRFAVEHWLFVANSALFLFITLPVLAPIFMKLGWTGPANVIYFVYAATCHQWPFRAYFLFGPEWTYSFETIQRIAGSAGVYTFVGNEAMGYKVAFCQRDVAIYLSMFLAGVLYAPIRSRVPILDWRLYVLFCLPMALDGFTQLFGFRESTWVLRGITGSIFGFGTVWLFYPYIEQSMRIVVRDFRRARGLTA